MRYRIGETPTEPVMSLDQGAFLAIALLSLAIGAGFVFAGIRSKHYWMAVWGTGLACSSLAYILLVIAIM
ncbi:MAG: hypothetical protein WBP44_08775 [Gammaproteobacteria bacterium]|jgi:hypothetical protein